MSTAAANLAARLKDFARGEDTAGDIPRIVRAAGPADHDAVVAALNVAADAVRDSHEYEYSGTIREDDRANLFTNVAGYMLSHGTAGTNDSAIVDEAIADSYDDGELQCEAAGCGEHAEVASITPGTTAYRHAYGEHDHEPLITEDGQRAALVRRVRSWSEPAGPVIADLGQLARWLEAFGLRGWAEALLAARPAEQPDAARAAAAKCDADLQDPGAAAAWPEFTGLPGALRNWAAATEKARPKTGDR